MNFNIEHNKTCTIPQSLIRFKEARSLLKITQPSPLAQLFPQNETSEEVKFQVQPSVEVLERIRQKILK